MSIVIRFADRVEFTVPINIESKINLKPNERSVKRMRGAAAVLVLIGTIIFGE
jgi:hypothetical protein